MLMGAACYDAAFLAQAAAAFGLDWHPAGTTRWPLYLTLATAVPCLFVALGLQECRPPVGAFGPAFRAAAANVRAGAAWIARDRRVLLVILAGLVVDGFVRLFLTFGSNYYRLIDLPAWTNGVLGSALGLLGFVAAPLARAMVRKYSAPQNFGVLWLGALGGLVGAAFATPVFGVWVLVPLGLAMSLLSFFLSNYLNDWAPSDVRATVLSFRGVAFNLGYGGIGLAFAALTAGLGGPGVDPDFTLRRALIWLPPAFVAGMLAFGLVALLSRRDDQR
jgi:hypothetical protein